MLGEDDLNSAAFRLLPDTPNDLPRLKLRPKCSWIFLGPSMTGIGDLPPDERGRREGRVLSDRTVRHKMAALALMAPCGHSVFACAALPCHELCYVALRTKKQANHHG